MHRTLSVRIAALLLLLPSLSIDSASARGNELEGASVIAPSLAWHHYTMMAVLVLVKLWACIKYRSTLCCHNSRVCKWCKRAMPCCHKKNATSVAEHAVTEEESIYACGRAVITTAAAAPSRVTAQLLPDYKNRPHAEPVADRHI